MPLTEELTPVLDEAEMDQWQWTTPAEAQTAIAAKAEKLPELKPLADFLANAGRGIVR